MTQQERENKIKELENQIAELKAMKFEEPQSNRWKPNTDEKYWVVRGFGETDWFCWIDDEMNNWHYLTGNCFKTKEEAEEYKKQIEYTARYKNYIEEHSKSIDWEGEQKKWYAEFDTEDGNIEVNCVYGYKVQGVIHASSEQIIKDAIKEIGEDNFKKYVLGVK